MDKNPPLKPDAMRAFADRVAFGRTADDYATHRAGFPPAFFALLAERGLAASGQRALDIGTGTGTVARGLAELGCRVTAIDPSPELLAKASRLSLEAGHTIDFVEGVAEALPFPDQSVDLVVAGQCWHWFDPVQAGAEAARVLIPGGRLVIAHFDWLPLPGTLVEATEALIVSHNPAWRGAGGTGLYPAWLDHMAGAGFGALETASFDIGQPYSHAAWRGRIRASAGVAASLDAGQVARFDAELAALLANQFPEDPQMIPHRVWFATGVLAPSASPQA